MAYNVKRDTIFPQKIIFTKNVADSEDLLKNHICQMVMPFEKGTKINENGCIIVDFGKEIYGNLRILVGHNEGNVSLRVTLGESAAEAFYSVGEFGACNDHSIHDLVYTPSAHTDFTTPKTGFRFAKLATGGGPSYIVSVMAETEMPDIEQRGFFRSDDELINKIAETAIYTATLCIQNNVIWDGIKRDRAVWIGDLHPEMLTISQLYGAIPQIKNSLSYVKYYVPEAWVNYHPAYSAWWIICLADYYLISANHDYVKELLRYVDKILSAFGKVIKEDGTISFENSSEKVFQDAEFYFDWPTNFQEDRKVGFSSLLRIALKKAIWIQHEFGIDNRYAEILYDRLGKRKCTNSSFKQIEAFNYLSGDKKEGVSEAIACGASKGMTCFMGYYILTAAANCGVENTLEIIKDFYGGMLSLGATTFWEDFDVEWLKDKPQGLDKVPDLKHKNIHRDYGKFCYKQLRHSLCHGWASGIYAFFIRTVLGIIPVEAGYKKIKISPHLLGLKFVEGKIPTPFGDIYVKHTLNGDSIDSRVDKPEEIEIVSE